MAQQTGSYLCLALLLLVAVCSASSIKHSHRAMMSLRPRPLEWGNRTHHPVHFAGGTAQEVSTQKPSVQPERYLELARPVDVPAGVKACSVRLLEHSFANTYNLPPAKATFKPPAEEECGNKWDNVVLKWKGACKGRQFDRLSIVWLNGVEIFRTCTAEPIPQGIVWEVEKDVTRYSALFQETAQLVVSLENVVNSNYTGIFHITLEALFYPSTKKPSIDDSGKFVESADVILPLTLVPEGGFIQRIHNSSQIVSVTTNSIPKNVIRAVVEVCVSFHEKDEFWYTNRPEVSNHSDGQGPFREVVVALDGKTVGAVWPFPVVYTGGLNPYLWRPTVAIGAFDLPTYDIEITPFVGQIVDGKHHTFSFSVPDCLSMCNVQGNLHLWLDARISQTSGKLLNYRVPRPSKKLDTHGYKAGLNGNFSTSAFRRISFSGYVNSSFGNTMSQVRYWYRFRNQLVFANESATMTIDQETSVDSDIVLSTEKRLFVNEQHFLSFPLRLNYQEHELADDSIYISVHISHAFDHDVYLPNLLPTGHTFTSVRNFQNVSGSLLIHPKTNGSHWEESDQSYVFASSDDCYTRNILAKNGTVRSDISDYPCRSPGTKDLSLDS